MTPAQIKLYWREWAATWRAITAARPDLTYRDAGIERHSLHRRALGYPKSSADLDNGEFDKVLAAFRSVSRPDDLRAQLRQINQPRGRMLWKIERVLLPRLAEALDGWQQAEAYVTAILLDRFNTDDYTTLPDRTMCQLVVTLNERVKHLEAAPLACPF